MPQDNTWFTANLHYLPQSDGSLPLDITAVAKTQNATKQRVETVTVLPNTYPNAGAGTSIATFTATKLVCIINLDQVNPLYVIWTNNTVSSATFPWQKILPGGLLIGNWDLYTTNNLVFGSALTTGTQKAQVFLFGT